MKYVIVIALIVVASFSVVNAKVIGSVVSLASSVIFTSEDFSVTKIVDSQGICYVANKSSSVSISCVK